MMDGKITPADMPEDMKSHEAEYWYAHLESGDATEADFATFDRWLAAHPENALSFEAICTVNESVMTLDHLAELEPIHRGSRREQRAGLWGWLQAPALATATLLMVVVGFSLYSGVLPLWVLDRSEYSTQVGEIRNLRLADGSDVALGARSEIEVVLYRGERRVKLVQGEAFFSVAKDKIRPFYVDTDGTEVKVVGTRFNVHSGEKTVTVDVEEGRVKVAKASSVLQSLLGQGDSSAAVLGAGQQVKSLSGGEISNPVEIDSDEVASWRQGVLRYDNVPLSQVINDVNRYSTTPITIGDPSLAEEAVTLAFRTNQIEDMLDSLSALLPIKIERTTDGKIKLGA